MELLMQPIGRSSVLEEVGQSLVPAAVRPGPRGGAMVEEQQVVAARVVDSADAQIFAANEALAGRRDSSPPTLELSTGMMNPRAPGWTNRLGIGDATPSRTPCPNRVNVFEKAVRSYADNLAENVITPVLGTTF